MRLGIDQITQASLFMRDDDALSLCKYIEGITKEKRHLDIAFNWQHLSPFPFIHGANQFSIVNECLQNSELRNQTTHISRAIRYARKIIMTQYLGQQDMLNFK